MALVNCIECGNPVSNKTCKCYYCGYSPKGSCKNCEYFEQGHREILGECTLTDKEFAEFDLQINLAISLHAPNNELRSKIMKINKRYQIEEVLDAVKYYIDKTNRRVTFEYILLKGINDTKEHAAELANLLKGINCYVNLIPMNSTVNEFTRSTKEKMNAFYQTLIKNNINVTLRKEQGHDIDAACGQLRIKRMQGEICKD